MNYRLDEIANDMYLEGLDQEFISNAFYAAKEYSGIAELRALWFHETDTVERDSIVSDIADMLEAIDIPQLGFDGA